MPWSKRRSTETGKLHSYSPQDASGGSLLSEGLEDDL